MSKHTERYEVTSDHSASIKGSNQSEGTRAFRRAQKEARHAI